MDRAHPAFQNPDGLPQTMVGGGEKMLSYEVHFFRADGTLSLRLHTAAIRRDDVLRALVKMQCREFVEVKVWRGLNRMVIRHRPAMSDPEADRPGHASGQPD